jgi:predicted Zn finger-like uncharacterized protein
MVAKLTTKAWRKARNPLQLETETLGQAVGRGQMRLICPNCDAEYEVDDAAIPDAGRDVQCSNCGHAWFQAGPGSDVAQDTAPAFPDDTRADAAPEVEPAEDQISMADAATPDLPMADLPMRARTVDESVMAVLQEEAAHEMAARRAEMAVPVETQPDLGLDAGGPAMQAQQTGNDVAGMAPVQTPPPPRQTTRREMLPDIEEINSTLRPSEAARDDNDDGPMVMPMAQARSGFRSGFVLMLLLAAVLVALYLMAPRLAQQIPGAKGALDAYVAAVDAGRVWLDGATKSVIGALQRLAGSP